MCKLFRCANMPISHSKVFKINFAKVRLKRSRKGGFLKYVRAIAGEPFAQKVGLHGLHFLWLTCFYITVNQGIVFVFAMK